MFTGCRSSQNCPSGHPLPCANQHVQLNNVSCSKDDNPSLVILILNPSLAFPMSATDIY